jgi:hypothetical protein
MKTSVLIGVVLIALGVAGFVYKTFSYTSEETVLQVGPVKATAEVEKDIAIPDVLSFVAIIAGIAVIAIGRGK